SRVNVPFPTRRSVSRRHSSGEPSHHSTRSGRASSATSSIQESSLGCRMGAETVPGIAETVIAHLLLVAVDRMYASPRPRGRSPAGLANLTAESRDSSGLPLSAPSQRQPPRGEVDQLVVAGAQRSLLTAE